MHTSQRSRQLVAELRVWAAEPMLSLVIMVQLKGL